MTCTGSWSTSRAIPRRAPGISRSPPKARTRQSPRSSTPQRRTRPRAAPRRPRASWRGSRWRRLPTAANEARARRTLLLAHYLLDAGESAASRAALEAFDASSVDGDLRAELLRDLGYCLWYEGEREAGYRLVLDALEHARDDEPRCAHARCRRVALARRRPRPCDRARRCGGRAARPGGASGAVLLVAPARHLPPAPERRRRRRSGLSARPRAARTADRLGRHEPRAGDVAALARSFRRGAARSTSAASSARSRKGT